MDYKDILDKREADWSSLWDRMDADRDLVTLAKYVLRDTDGKKIPNSVSITLNDPLVFAVNVESALSSAVEQVTVESENKRLDTAYIEELLKCVFKEADQTLSLRGEWGLDAFTDQMNCRRGRGAARIILRYEDGLIIPEIIPWDTRYVTYVIDSKGLAAIQYKTTRPRDMIIADYPHIKLDDKSENFEVRDIWMRESNEVWVANQQAIERQVHGFDSVPVAYQIVPMGSAMKDEDAIQYQGESIFFMIRDLIPELNRLVSIIQSMDIKALDRALQLKIPKEELPLKEIPKHDTVTKPGAVNAVAADGGYDLMPLGELQQHAYLLHQMIESRIQRGGVNNFDMGTFNQPMSAVALVTIGEGRDQVFMPRLGTRGLLKQQLARQAINQILTLSDQNGFDTFKIGRREFKVSSLDDEYDITFKYFNKSPKIDIAKYDIAASAGNLISETKKRRDILQVEDPDEEERLLRSEEAERVSANIKYYRIIKALLDEAERGDEDAQLEAELMATELGLNIESMMTGNFGMGTPAAPQAPNPNGLLPLMKGTKSLEQPFAQQTTMTPQGASSQSPRTPGVMPTGAANG